MTKDEWIRWIQEKSGQPTKTTVEAVVNAVVASIAPALRTTGRLQVHGLGTFKARERPARMARNPRTGDPVDVPASTTVGFKAAPGFLASLEPRTKARKGAKRPDTAKR